MTGTDAMLWVYAAIGIIVVGGMVVNLVVPEAGQKQ